MKRKIRNNLIALAFGFLGIAAAYFYKQWSDTKKSVQNLQEQLDQRAEQDSLKFQQIAQGNDRLSNTNDNLINELNKLSTRNGELSDTVYVLRDSIDLLKLDLAALRRDFDVATSDNRLLRAGISLENLQEVDPQTEDKDCPEIIQDRDRRIRILEVQLQECKNGLY